MKKKFITLLQQITLSGVPFEHDMSDDEVTGYGDQTGNHYRETCPVIKIT